MGDEHSPCDGLLRCRRLRLRRARCSTRCRCDAGERAHLSTTAIDGSGVSVTWEDTGGSTTIDAWTYQLELSDGTRHFHDYLPADQRQRVHASLRLGSYRIFVLAHNRYGPGAWATEEFTIPDGE